MRNPVSKVPVLAELLAVDGLDRLPGLDGHRRRNDGGRVGDLPDLAPQVDHLPQQDEAVADVVRRGVLRGDALAMNCLEFGGSVTEHAFVKDYRVTHLIV